MTHAARRRARFEDVTETTGTPVTAEAAAMMYTRYHVGAALGAGKRVLELACGGGNGLGLLAATATRLTGGDVSAPLLRAARSHYGARVPLVRLSAEALPFRKRAFDVVCLFEASYYVPDIEAAFDEIARVLGPDGQVLFVNANPDRPDFIRSPHSTRYHSATDFRVALERRGFSVSVRGAFPVEPQARGRSARLKAGTMAMARRVAETLRLVPRTLRGRARLKRFIFGRLDALPPELPAGFAAVEPLVPVETTARSHTGRFKVIYVLGRLPGAVA